MTSIPRTSVLLAFLVACAHTVAPLPKPDLARARAQIEQADRDFAEAVALHGEQGFRAFLDRDVTFLPPGEDFARGPDAAFLSWEPILRGRTGKLTWAPIDAYVAESADLGYTLGHWTFQGTGADGAPVERHGKYVTIWRKQADGSWKVLVDGGNAGPTPAPPPSTP